MTVEVDAFGRNVRNISEKAAEDGKIYILRLIGDFKIICRGCCLKGSGSAVVMDMYTGELFWALLSYPTFDPSIFFA